MEQVNPLDENKTIDIQYTNGNIAGKFRYKLKQKTINWIIGTILSSCTVHSYWMHYHFNQIERDHEQTVRSLVDTQTLLAIAQTKLEEAQNRESTYIQVLAAKCK